MLTVFYDPCPCIRVATHSLRNVTRCVLLWLCWITHHALRKVNLFVANRISRNKKQCKKKSSIWSRNVRPFCLQENDALRTPPKWEIDFVTNASGLKYFRCDKRFSRKPYPNYAQQNAVHAISGSFGRRSFCGHAITLANPYQLVPNET